MAHVLNATLRLSQRASTRTVSHVLSGSTRSLSSTSSPAVRGCAARNASFVTAFSNSMHSNVFSGARTFSTKPQDVEERAESVLGGIKETLEQTQTEQPQEPEAQRSRRPDRVHAPSKTFFVAGLPFFATEEDLRKVFEGCGNITDVRFGAPKRANQAPFAFVTMESMTEAVTIVESSKEEPYVLEGRTLTVNWTNRVSKYPPSKVIYFDNFNDGDLGKLRDFLGELAPVVDNAWFSHDKHHSGSWLPSGMIQCRSIEDATAVIQACNGKAGPDGLPVLLRYAIMKEKRDR